MYTEGWKVRTFEACIHISQSLFFSENGTYLTIINMIITTFTRF
ncbi:hypothetical protein SRABI96_02783 [Peribacillus sp. Bi96]|nr:hypothetical protein SRABI96_02783 [Peribacillus sp. Bi96]